MEPKEFLKQMENRFKKANYTTRDHLVRPRSKDYWIEISRPEISEYHAIFHVCVGQLSNNDGKCIIYYIFHFDTYHKLPNIPEKVVRNITVNKSGFVERVRTIVNSTNDYDLKEIRFTEVFHKTSFLWSDIINSPEQYSKIIKKAVEQLFNDFDVLILDSFLKQQIKPVFKQEKQVNQTEPKQEKPKSPQMDKFIITQQPKQPGEKNDKQLHLKEDLPEPPLVIPKVHKKSFFQIILSMLRWIQHLIKR